MKKIKHILLLQLGTILLSGCSIFHQVEANIAAKKAAKAEANALYFFNNNPDKLYKLCGAIATIKTDTNSTIQYVKGVEDPSIYANDNISDIIAKIVAQVTNENRAQILDSLKRHPIALQSPCPPQRVDTYRITNNYSSENQSQINYLQSLVSRLRNDSASLQQSSRDLNSLIAIKKHRIVIDDIIFGSILLLILLFVFLKIYLSKIKL